MDHLTLPSHVCTECHCSTDVYFQTSPRGEDIYNGQTGWFVATCWDKNCDFYSVSQSITEHANMPEAKRESYRQMNRQNRAAGLLAVAS